MPRSELSGGAVVAVCLGSGITTDGAATETTRLRAEAAIELAKSLAQSDPNMTIIVSGDGRKETNPALRATLKSEAAVMADILMEASISPRRILIEDQSRDTIGNAVLTAARYLHGQTPRRVYVVTSPFHTERALASFKGVLGDGWELIAHASAIASDDARRGANESGGITWTKAFFEGITPGDLPAVARRLLEIGKPAYRRLTRLRRLAKQAVKT